MILIYSALVLTEKSRMKILQKFSPVFSSVKCDHVTLNYPAKSEKKELENDFKVFVVGYKIDSELGVECLVVEVNESSIRSDGCLYHVTLSLDPNKKAKAALSNEILSNHQYRKFNESFEIATEFKLIKCVNA